MLNDIDPRKMGDSVDDIGLLSLIVGGLVLGSLFIYYRSRYHRYKIMKSIKNAKNNRK